MAIAIQLLSFDAFLLIPRREGTITAASEPLCVAHVISLSKPRALGFAAGHGPRVGDCHFGPMPAAHTGRAESAPRRRSTIDGSRRKPISIAYYARIDFGSAGATYWLPSMAITCSLISMRRLEAGTMRRSSGLRRLRERGRLHDIRGEISVALDGHARQVTATTRAHAQ